MNIGKGRESKRRGIEEEEVEEEEYSIRYSIV
jgi:hypothetical protein